jgi:lipoyl(octanoyl) transferase
MGRNSGAAGLDGSRAAVASAAVLSCWHLWIDETPRPGWANMSIDLALLDRAEHYAESWLRLYQWNPYCLSFGRHEPATTRYDAGRIRALGVDTVRRPTGGRAVWHARELTYAVTSPWSRFGSLRGAYLEIQRLLSEALRSLGIPASLAPPAGAAPLDAGACFSHPLGGEVLVAGRKVVGSAQLRRGSALLQHGSILLHDDQAVVAALLRGTADRAPPAGFTTSTEGLKGDCLTGRQGVPLRPGEVAAAIAESAQRRWAWDWEPVVGVDLIMDAASRHYSQFQSPTWTWTR